MNNWIDLSHPVSSDMPVYPGTPPVEAVCLGEIEKDDFSEYRYLINTHAGTHMDAPAHPIPGFISLNRIPVDRFQGWAYNTCKCINKAYSLYQKAHATFSS